MDVRGSLGRVRTWVWLGLLGAAGTLGNYLIENGKLPDWLSGNAGTLTDQVLEALATFGRWLTTEVGISRWLLILLCIVLFLVVSVLCFAFWNHFKNANSDDRDSSCLSSAELTLFNVVARGANLGHAVTWETFLSSGMPRIATEHALEQLYNRGLVDNDRLTRSFFNLTPRGRAYYLHLESLGKI